MSRKSGPEKFVQPSAPSSSKPCDAQSKLQEKVEQSVTGLAQLARQVARGSGSQDILGRVARNFCQQEAVVESSSSHLTRMQLISSHMHCQTDSLVKSANQLIDVNDQLSFMLES